MKRLNVLLTDFFVILSLFFFFQGLWTDNHDWSFAATLILIPSSILHGIFERCPYCNAKVNPNRFGRRVACRCRHCGKLVEYSE